MTLSLICVCHFLCFFSCSPWPFVHHPRSCRASWVSMWNYGAPHKSLPILNRKNGSTDGVLNPCHSAAGGWRRRRNQQAHDGQEGENHRRTPADRERLYQRPGSLHQGSDPAPERQAGECWGQRRRQWCQGLSSATFCLRQVWSQRCGKGCARALVRRVEGQIYFWPLVLHLPKACIEACPEARLDITSLGYYIAASGSPYCSVVITHVKCHSRCLLVPPKPSFFPQKKLEWHEPLHQG